MSTSPAEGFCVGDDVTDGNTLVKTLMIGSACGRPTRRRHGHMLVKKRDDMVDSSCREQREGQVVHAPYAGKPIVMRSMTNTKSVIAVKRIAGLLLPHLPSCRQRRRRDTGSTRSCSRVSVSQRMRVAYREPAHLRVVNFTTAEWAFTRVCV